MIVNKKELVNALAAVEPGVSKKEVIEQATHYIFTGNEICTFSDMIMVTFPFETGMECSVKAEDFLKIVKNINEESFEMALEETTLKITAKKTKAGLAVILGENAMVKNMAVEIKAIFDTPNFWHTVPKDFIEGIHLCSFSASKDLTSGMFSCCGVKNNRIYTTDKVRASMYTMESEMEDMLIPAKYAAELVKYDVVEYGISANWAHFKTSNGITFNCKKMSGDFPYVGIEQYVMNKQVDLILPGTLPVAVTAVTLMAEGDTDVNKHIEVTIENGQIACKAKKDRGWITKLVDVEYTGEQISFNINPLFFLEILKYANEFSLEENRGLFVSEKFNHVLSLPIKH